MGAGGDFSSFKIDCYRKRIRAESIVKLVALAEFALKLASMAPLSGAKTTSLEPSNLADFTTAPVLSIAQSTPPRPIAGKAQSTICLRAP